MLTEDTDSFIIGERVWVGGTKPGQIAYIGETQFAPGEWAGIVLDDAIGKQCNITIIINHRISSAFYMTEKYYDYFQVKMMVQWQECDISNVRKSEACFLD